MSHSPAPMKAHRMFFLRPSKDLARGRLHALCMRLGSVILVVRAPTRTNEPCWFIEFQCGVDIAALVSLMLRHNCIENGQHVSPNPPEDIDWQAMGDSPRQIKKSAEISPPIVTPSALDDAREGTCDREMTTGDEGSGESIVAENRKYVYVIRPSTSFNAESIEHKLQSVGIERIVNCREWKERDIERVICVELPSVQETMRTLSLQVLVGDAGWVSPLLSHENFVSYQRRQQTASLRVQKSSSGRRDWRRRSGSKRSWQASHWDN